MTHVCAWCGKVIGKVQGTPAAEDIVRHGLCEPCRDRMWNDYREQKAKARKETAR
jgi:hypothetical protein